MTSLSDLTDEYEFLDSEDRYRLLIDLASGRGGWGIHSRNAFAGLPFGGSCYIVSAAQTSICIHMSGISSKIHHPQRPVRPGPRFQMPRIVMALMLREMATTYGRSAGGYLWAILEPILGIALFNDIANKAGRLNPIFAAVPGLSQRHLCRYPDRPDPSERPDPYGDRGHRRHGDRGDLSTAGRLRPSRHLPVPAVRRHAGHGRGHAELLPDHGLSDLGTGLVHPDAAVVPDVFLYGMMPMQAQNILWYNPLIHCVGMMRQGLYPTYAGDYLSPGYVIGVSVVLFVLGLMLLERNYKRLLER